MPIHVKHFLLIPSTFSTSNKKQVQPLRPPAAGRNGRFMNRKMFRLVSCTPNDVVVEDIFLQNQQMATQVARRYLNEGLAQSVVMYVHDDLDSCGIIRYVGTYVKEE